MTNQPLAWKWSEEMKASHRELHDEGKSATLIALDLNAKYGTKLTRNAVIGAAHRAGLTKRASKTFSENWPCTRRPTERRKDNGGGSVYSIARRQVTGFRPLEKQKISEAPFLGVELLKIKDGQCRFPRGEIPTILFCGQPQKENSSYCPHCHSIATRPWNAS